MAEFFSPNPLLLEKPLTMPTIESLFETYQRAVLRKDADDFVSIFDEQVRIFDMWHSEYAGLASWRKMVEDWFGSLGTEKVVVTFEDIQVHSSGDIGCATAFARFAAIAESGEELRSLHNRFTWVVKKKNDRWIVIHEHTSGPVDGQTMKVMLTR